MIYLFQRVTPECVDLTNAAAFLVMVDAALGGSKKWRRVRKGEGKRKEEAKWMTRKVKS